MTTELTTPRARRLARGLSLREVARRMRLSAPYVSDLERGQRSWRADLRTRYAEALADGTGPLENSLDTPLAPCEDGVTQHETRTATTDNDTTRTP